MKVYVVIGDPGYVYGVFADKADAETELALVRESNNLVELVERDLQPTSTPAFIPEGWTMEQTKSAIRVCKRYEEPFIWSEWTMYDNYIGTFFHGARIFIGIEKDGYAHS
jgi:hypothetical protein